MLYVADAGGDKVVSDNKSQVQALAGIQLQTVNETPGSTLPAVVTPLGTLYLDLSSSIDVEAEKTRLTKELEKLNKLVAAGEGKLKNPKFVDGAPAEIVDGARKQLAEVTGKRDETKRILESLS